LWARKKYTTFPYYVMHFCCEHKNTPSPTWPRDITVNTCTHDTVNCTHCHYGYLT
jgi:hypothetical protein